MTAEKLNNLTTNVLSDNVVVSVKNVSKKFCKHLRHSMAHGIVDLSKSLFGIKPNTTELRRDEFWAVDDVSFELKKGEVLGLIGLNGSGKSTLLRLLAGILPPDKGEISVKGRVGALIAIGAGFHPHMTGRENIHLNGTILGMTREEIHSRFDEIVDFAEIRDFLDAPVSTYSSGMRVRLGFSIAAHMDPAVAIIDEVLAVGDFSFRQKCSDKINDIRNRSSVIIVSHNMRDILMLCGKVILLHKGEVVCQGVPEEAVDYYLHTMNVEENTKVKQIESTMGAASQPHSTDRIYGEMFHNQKKITDVQHRWVDESKETTNLIDHGAIVTLEFSFRLLKPVSNLVIGVPIFDGRSMITASNTDAERASIKVDEDGSVTGRLIIKDLVLNPGKYKSVFVVMDAKEYLYRGFIHEFQVKELPFYFGVVTMKQQWHFEV